MKRTLIMGCLCLIAWAHPAKAVTDGNDLRNNCDAVLKGESGARAGLCAGFMDGYRQLASMLPDQKLLCLPSEGVKMEQFIKVVIKYLDQHPEKLHLPAAQLIYDSTNEAFPCSIPRK